MTDAEKPKTVDVPLGAWPWSDGPIFNADGTAATNDQIVDLRREFDRLKAEARNADVKVPKVPE